MSFFSRADKTCLGIDIGTTSIKLVELKKDQGAFKLLTYGFSECPENSKINWQDKPEITAGIINKIQKKARTTGIEAVSALPTFSVFSSILNLARVSDKELSAAVHWEAKKVVPLPLEEMILDWKRIKTEEDKDKDDIRVLLTGAPQALVKKYIKVFQEAGLSLLSLETETFSLIRSLVGSDRSTVMLVEFGASTTDVTIVDQGIPILNRSIDVGGEKITRAISQSLDIGLEKAEQFKYDLGISSLDDSKSQLPRVVAETISPVVNEIKYAINLFQTKHRKDTEKIILSGGSSLLPDLTGYLGKILDMKVIIGDPWSRVSYPEDLKPLLQEIGPRMAVAIGLAIRELE
jgi:type IV pilus assembly protein PilM